jgi:hypothetical protein
MSYNQKMAFRTFFLLFVCYFYENHSNEVHCIWVFLSGMLVNSSELFIEFSNKKPSLLYVHNILFPVAEFLNAKARKLFTPCL